jgi:membrane protease subunit HflK
VIDQKGSGGNLLYLPLDKLMATVEAMPAQPAASAPATPSVEELNAQRSREAFRSRERESRP